MPQEKGVPLGRWSSAEIAGYLIAVGVVGKIAAVTVARWLSSEKLKPWRYHTWQKIVDREAFLERARPVLQLYAQAKALLRQGIWVVCADEKTSLQARESEQTPTAAAPEQPVQLAPRYKRRGALNLFGGLSVADGQVYGQCHGRKRFLEFQTFLLTVILPEALRRGVNTLILILDNGTTHAPKQLEAWLRAAIASQGLALAAEVYWLPPRASWLDQIEIWFSVLQRKLLQPNHFVSLEQLKILLLAFIDHYNKTAQAIRWSYTVEKLEKKLGINL